MIFSIFGLALRYALEWFTPDVQRVRTQEVTVRKVLRTRFCSCFSAQKQGFLLVWSFLGFIAVPYCFE